MGSAAQTAEEEAAAWFARMSSDKKSDADAHEFDEWLAANPENARAYASFQRLWGDLGAFGEAPEILAAQHESLEAARRSRRQWIAGGLTSALAVAAAAAFFFLMPHEPAATTYETLAGQRSTINLADHSAIELGPNSQLIVRLGAHERVAELVRGRAFFDIDHEADRPFMVRHGRREVRVLGTQFDVDTEEADLAVILVAGSVRISDTAHGRTLATLAPNYAYVERNGLAQVAPVDADNQSAWRFGRLVFDDVALGDALHQLNRFSPQPIKLSESRLSMLRVSGTFHIGEISTTVSALEQSFPVRAQRAADGSVTLYPR
ncbi:fecR-like transmembrane sensor [alpha proteobacterium U9-1i]|nr:fecR-like transmembrane sensor [alpha proteobacterium U9-1i]